MGLLGARDHEQARGVAVEAMDDPRAVLLTAGCPGRGERMGERAAAGVTRRRMHDDAGGLVDDEQVLVLVADGQLGRRDRGLGGRRLRRLDRDFLSAGELVALSARLAVDKDRTGREQSLGSGTRSDVRQRSQVAVEPLPRGLRRDDVALQRLEARGSCSARTSAASRIPTPITMKLSARLNAGQ